MTATGHNMAIAMLVRLEGQGHITRKPHPTDGRAWSVSLTRKGRGTHGRLGAASTTFWQRLVSAVGSKRATSLIKDLSRVAETMAPANVVRR